MADVFTETGRDNVFFGNGQGGKYMELINLQVGGANTGTAVSVNTTMRKVIHANVTPNGTAAAAGVIPYLQEAGNVDGNGYINTTGSSISFFWAAAVTDVRYQFQLIGY